MVLKNDLFFYVRLVVSRAFEVEHRVVKVNKCPRRPNCLPLLPGDDNHPKALCDWPENKQQFLAYLSVSYVVNHWDNEQKVATWYDEKVKFVPTALSQVFLKSFHPNSSTEVNSNGQIKNEFDYNKSGRFGNFEAVNYCSYYKQATRHEQPNIKVLTFPWIVDSL